MNIKHLQLGGTGSECATDTITGVKGTLLHCLYELGGTVYYNFRPGGLTKEGKPPHGHFISSHRIKGGKVVETNLPVEALGTMATDKLSGYKGNIISLTLHLNGCVHVQVIPEGVDKKTGSIREAQDFDIRLMTGPGIKRFTQAELAADIVKKPSPMEMPTMPH